jgi:hypothetical protein
VGSHMSLMVVAQQLRVLIVSLKSAEKLRGVWIDIVVSENNFSLMLVEITCLWFVSYFQLDLAFV